MIKLFLILYTIAWIFLLIYDIYHQDNHGGRPRRRKAYRKSTNVYMYTVGKQCQVQDKDRETSRTAVFGLSNKLNIIEWKISSMFWGNTSSKPCVPSAIE